MKKILLLIFSIIFLAISIQCEKELTQPTESLSPQVNYLTKKLDTPQNRLKERQLKAFAYSLAISLNEPEVCSIVKDKIGERFDGDYNVLWSDVKDKTLNDATTLRQSISSNLKNIAEFHFKLNEIEKLSLLQIAMPVGFENWNGLEPVIVAYTPLTKNDIDVEEIYGFDSKGKKVTLDGKVPPEFPLIVVGLNERGGKSSKGDVTIVNSDGLKKTAITSNLIVERVNLHLHPDNYESYWNGAADLYIAVFRNDTKYWSAYEDHEYKCWKWKLFTGWISKYNYWRDYSSWSETITFDGSDGSYEIRLMEADGSELDWRVYPSNTEWDDDWLGDAPIPKYGPLSYEIYEHYRDGDSRHWASTDYNYGPI